MRDWTSEEDEFLIANQLTMAYQDIATTLGRSYDSVAHRVFRLRLGMPISEQPPIKYLSKPLIDVSKINETEKAYLAGYIDADGSVQVNRVFTHNTPRFYPCIQITSMDESIMRYFSELLKVRPVKGKARWSNNEPVYMIHLTRIADVKQIMTAILPYLKLKKQEGEIALKMALLKLQRPKRGQFSPELVQLFTEYSTIRHSRRRGRNAFKI